MKNADKTTHGKDKIRWVWHLFKVRCVAARFPGVSRGSTPGYCLPTLWVGGSDNLKGCQTVAGGRSQAKTSGCRSTNVPQPGGLAELLPATPNYNRFRFIRRPFESSLLPNWDLTSALSCFKLIIDGRALP
jgi:hypothetical protein